MNEDDIRKRKVFNEYLRLVQDDSADFFVSTNFEAITCPACMTDSYTFQFEKNGFPYVSCNSCETLYVNPRPQYTILNQFYTDSPSTKFWVESFFMPVAEKRQELIFKPRAEYIASRFPEKKNGVICDIGAGFGLFLEEMSKFTLPHNLYAIEPSIDMVDICKKKGFNTIPSSLEDVEGYTEKFDIITAFELFEHLHNPKAFVDKVFELLKPGGYFVLTTLNGKGFDIQVLWEKSKSVSPPHHLNFFNPHSMDLFFKNNGFKIIEIETPGQLDVDILEGAYRYDGVDVGRFFETVCSSSGDTKAELQEWISRNRLSSHMRVIVQKNERVVQRARAK